MNAALQSLVDRYEPATAADWENALREIVQELALLGLWRSKFYEHAAFYGGTALRIFHGLPRYSENLEFSLLAPEAAFDLAPHMEAVRAELGSYGFAFEVEKKEKQVETAIDPAFIKGNTRINLLEIGVPGGLENHFPPGRKLKIKMELDTDPPAGAETEVETLLLPIPFQVKLYRPSCLFAGKIHALLCRNWKRRVKGRDFYDFVWYLAKGVPVHLAHLQKRMEQTGHREGGEALTGEALRGLLRKRFAEVDFDQARADVLPFIRDADAVALWGETFFTGLLDRLKVE